MTPCLSNLSCLSVHMCFDEVQLSGLRKSQRIHMLLEESLGELNGNGKLLGVECSVERVTVSRKYGAEHRAVSLSPGKGEHEGKGKEITFPQQTWLEPTCLL